MSRGSPKTQQKGELKRKSFRMVLRNFISETVDLVEGGEPTLPVSAKLLKDCWKNRTGIR